MSSFSDTLKADIKARVQKAYQQATITAAKNRFLWDNGPCLIFGQDKIPAALQRRIVGYENKIVTLPRRLVGGTHIDTPVGVVIGVAGDKNNILAVIALDDGSVEVSSLENINIEDIATGSAFEMVGEILLTAKYQEVISTPTFGQETIHGTIYEYITKRLESYEIPGSTSKYKFYFNLVQKEQDNRYRNYFFLGVQIRDSDYTDKTIDLLKQINTSGQISVSDYYGLPSQIGITPLIDLAEFLKKFDITEITNCKTIMRYYGLDMVSSNYAGMTVKSITTRSNLFLSLADLEALYNKSEAKAAYEKQTNIKMTFELMKTRLMNFICSHKFTPINIRGASFIFYDNEVYDLFIEKILPAALSLARRHQEQVARYETRMILSQMLIPPFFIDLDDWVLLPADAYNGHGDIMKYMGEEGKPTKPSQIRNQDTFIIICGVLERLAQKPYSANKLLLSIQLALG
jgi:hypothetical protein